MKQYHFVYLHRKAKYTSNILLFSPLPPSPGPFSFLDILRKIVIHRKMYFNLLQTPRNNPLLSHHFFLQSRIASIAIISSNTQPFSYCLLVFKRENNRVDDEFSPMSFFIHSQLCFLIFFNLYIFPECFTFTNQIGYNMLITIHLVR